MEESKHDADVSAMTIYGLRFKLAGKFGRFKFTQAEFADLFGIHRTTVCNYENLKRRPAAYIRHRIIVFCTKYGLDINLSDFDPKSRFKLNYFRKVQCYLKIIRSKRNKNIQSIY